MRLAALAMVSGGVAYPQFARAAGGTLNFADIGVGDPGGDWSKFTAASGYNVNLVSIGNAPSAILNVLVTSGGQGTYDVINIVGGMQKPLVEKVAPPKPSEEVTQKVSEKQEVKTNSQPPPSAENKPEAKPDNKEQKPDQIAEANGSP